MVSAAIEHCGMVILCIVRLGITGSRKTPLDVYCSPSRSKLDIYELTWLIILINDHGNDRNINYQHDFPTDKSWAKVLTFKKSTRFSWAYNIKLLQS
jgi:hypothetical protein